MIGDIDYFVLGKERTGWWRACSAACDQSHQHAFLLCDDDVATEESVTPETKPSEPNPGEFGNTADKSVDAGIADETAAYDQAMERDDANPQDSEDVADSVTGKG